MILREYISSTLRRNSLNEALKAHILNFYEDLEMPLGELYEVVDAIAEGKLENVTEKMDGQNVTFSVINGELQLFSKGATWKRVQKGGLTFDAIREKYSDRPTVRDAFIDSLTAIKDVVDANPENAARLFQNGKVVVESSIQMPGNPNTIVYDEPSIQFIQAVALAPDSEVNRDAYNVFVEEAKRLTKEGHKVDMGLVPYLKLQKSLEKDKALQSKIKSKLDSLLSKTGTTKSDTIGDMAVNLVKRQLDILGTVPDELLDKAAQRIGTGNKSLLTKKEYVSKSSLQDWRTFQELDKRRNDIVAEALVPLEHIIQLMGVYAFRNLEFAIASNSSESGEELRRWVRQVKNAFKSDDILADPKTTERIRIALERIGDQEEYFEKAVEGIVFTWKGKTRKLTGLFTPINKLRGFFAYGKEPARIRESRQRLSEGGNAFKDASGEPITVAIEKARVKPTLDHFKRHVLEKVNINDYVMLGSTGKKEMSGDLDIAIPVPSYISAKDYKKELYADFSKILGADAVKVIGQNLAVAYPVIGTPDQLVQIDIMLTSNLQGTGWLMSGHGADRVKGVYRNLLLAYVAAILSKKISASSGEKVKFTLGFPSGLLVKKNGKPVGDRIKDPDSILSMLRIDATPDEVSSFESLFEILKENPVYAEYLSGFEKYIGHMKKSSPESAKRAIAYVNQSLNEANLRYFINNILRG